MSERSLGGENGSGSVPSTAADLDDADEALLLDAIDRWVERDVKPVVKEYDHADRYPTQIVEQMQELGLFGATIGQEYGGLGLRASTYAQIVMRISPNPDSE